MDFGEKHHVLLIKRICLELVEVQKLWVRILDEHRVRMLGNEGTRWLASLILEQSDEMTLLKKGMKL